MLCEYSLWWSMHQRRILSTPHFLPVMQTITWKIRAPIFQVMSEYQVLLETFFWWPPFNMTSSLKLLIMCTFVLISFQMCFKLSFINFHEFMGNNVLEYYRLDWDLKSIKFLIFQKEKYFDLRCESLSLKSIMKLNIGNLGLIFLGNKLGFLIKGVKCCR